MVIIKQEVLQVVKMKKQKKNIPFECCNTGTCDSCKTKKYLDSMLIKDYTKGLYECVDCKVEKESKHYEKVFSDGLKIVSSKKEGSKIKKFVGVIVG